MAKLYKVEMYILDVNEEYKNFQDIINSLEYKTDLNLKCFNHEKSIFQWNDDLKINHSNAKLEDYRDYFKKFKVVRTMEFGTWNNPQYCSTVMYEAKTKGEAFEWIKNQPKRLQCELSIEEKN